MIIPDNLRADYSMLCGGKLNRIISSPTPVLSWGGITDEKDDFQTAFRVKVYCENCLMWDSGVVENATPFVKYAGEKLPVGKRIDFSVSVAGNNGAFSQWVEDYFYLGTFDTLPDAKWICASDDVESVPIYFNKDIVLDKDISHGVMFVSGIGYHQVTVNGKRIDGTYLNPGISDYNKACYYMVVPDIEEYFDAGENRITIAVADGWRRNNGDYLRIYNNSPDFFGAPCLWAALRITYTDGSEQWVCTDVSWNWCRGNIVFSHLFDGEIYDANTENTENYPVKLFGDTLGELRPMTVQPITEYKTFSPTSIYNVGGKYIIDFGVNMSGIIKVKIPKGLDKGHKITIRHAQLLNDDGTLNVENLRGAKCEDTYIASGDINELQVWSPTFTYHGFRYAEVEGIPLIDKDDITAVMICTELEETVNFVCGSSVINAIHNMAIQTEHSTCHGVFNDTCGRSERMHWYGDGSVRYGEVGYNFDVSKIIPHIMELIRDTQQEDGSISCTAPYINGKRPADALSSSYLIAADMLYTLTGNIDIISEYYDSMCAWQNCLLNISDGYILNHCYIGDWAGPEYSRDHSTKGGGAGSATIPPAIMGTAYFMNGARLLEKFALILGKAEDALYYKDLHNKIKSAFLDNWYHKGTGKVYNGSQSCQALALWFDILPEADRPKAAKLMRDDLADNGYKFTTGAYCTAYMCAMLIEYGYVDEFYKLITGDEYPSFGYMLQCDATTCWEKFEYLTGNGMNAHIHPGHIGVAQCFYRYIAGVLPVSSGASEFNINPRYPTDLLTASMTYKTIRGDINVRWRKHDGNTNLCVSVPFNTKANIYTPDGVKTVGSGFHSFVW